MHRQPVADERPLDAAGDRDAPERHGRSDGYFAGARDSTTHLTLAEALAARQRAGRLRLLLDYDGTLVPIAMAPEGAAPGRDLLQLLTSLCRSPGLDAEIVSGRARDTLAAWLGHLPMALWAEHGLWHRPSGSREWIETVPGSNGWMRDVLPVLARFAVAVPGARIEQKSASIAWHYREARPDVGRLHARELRRALLELTARRPVDVIEGKMVIEVRRAGVTKALVARHLETLGIEPRQVLAFGDDQTDEELFAALPAACLTVAVGPDIRASRFRVATHDDVRRLLVTLVQEATRATTSPRP